LIKKILRKINNKILFLKQTGNSIKDAGVYWSLSNRNESIKDMSHWRGVGRWSEHNWMRLGDFHLEVVNDFFRNYNIKELNRINSGNALEWGPGGGANIRFLCNMFNKVFGADISESNLNECSEQMRNLNINNFVPAKIDSENPEMILQKIEESSIDFLFSTAVFQHFPSKIYTERILDIMFKVLKSDGYGLIQIRYDDENKYVQKNNNYFENVLIMNVFKNNEFIEMLHGHGFKCLDKKRNIDGNNPSYEYYFINKK
jgi:ubiquinone/menaquinone biosynthesis C-methylase UbiE